MLERVVLWGIFYRILFCLIMVSDKCAFSDFVKNMSKFSVFKGIGFPVYVKNVTHE